MLNTKKPRLKPFCDVTDGELTTALEAVKSSFSERWLCEASSNHLLQQLWNRRDSIATTELYALGRAIGMARAIDSLWVDGLVSTIRKPDENNQRGALFEICACSYLAERGQRVVPAPKNQRGFDLRVHFGSEAVRYYSLKAHGRSQAERSFAARMDGIRQLFVGVAAGRIGPAHLIVQLARYPLEADWQTLRSQLRALVDDYRLKKTADRDLGFGRVRLRALSVGPEDVLARSRFSYTVSASCQFHSGEVKNFTDKLEIAVSNLIRHVEKVPSAQRSVFLKLPSTVSLRPLLEAARQFTDAGNPQCIENITALQPYWARHPGQDSPQIYMYGDAISSGAMNAAQESPAIVLPVGIVTDIPPLFRFGSSSESLLLESHYWYQYGEHFLLAMETPEGARVTISLKEPGVRTKILLHDSVDCPAVVGVAGYGLSLLGD